ncbi:MAG: ferrous iron transport protein B [Gemmatimonadaceae bacterium]|jgi:ferrous iron transport protein B|nr:ferrous iron transport protein B [Gemmatimonadaceae bacterium]
MALSPARSLTAPSAPDLGDRAVALPTRVALIGNPNTGKTTLFNALTGLRQRVGNFAGVTVERVEGTYRAADGRTVAVLDLPGTYSLATASPDEVIAHDILMRRASDGWAPDVIVAVVDATHLERNLFLVSQLLELGDPLVVALNQADAAERDGTRIDVPELSFALGVPVIPTVATRGEGLEPLRRAIDSAVRLPRPSRRFTLPPAVAAAVAPLELRLEEHGYSRAEAQLEAMRLLSIDGADGARLDGAVERARQALRTAGEDPRRIEASLRYAWISGVVIQSVTHTDRPTHGISDRIDAVVLHRVGGPLIFLALMALVFQALFTWATPLQDGLEALVAWAGARVADVMPAGDLRSLLVDGVIAGVGSVVVFLPQIAILFTCIGVLEDSGYMARAALLMDRVMRRVGLHGRSFIPMLSGYACAVPAIMATRTIGESKDRLATIMVVPLMSCSARLPVYTLLIGAFIPATLLFGSVSLQSLTLLAMYLLGTAAALGAAAVFKRTLLKGPVRPMILELPPYRWPSPRALAVAVAQRCRLFLRRAGTVILTLSIVLWALATWPRLPVDGSLPEARQRELALEHSALGRIGRAIEPAVAPLGFDWKIGVSIAASFAAREVFVSTMGTIYGVGGDDDTDRLTDALRRERRADGSPVYSLPVALSLLVFYVFALMCMSTVAITVREAGGGATGWRWAALQFGYMLVLAWGAAFVTYRAALALGG